MKQWEIKYISRFYVRFSEVLLFLGTESLLPLFSNLIPFLIIFLISINLDFLYLILFIIYFFPNLDSIKLYRNN